jgi:hypothetical protein
VQRHFCLGVLLAALSVTGCGGTSQTTLAAAVSRAAAACRQYEAYERAEYTHRQQTHTQAVFPFPNAELARESAHRTAELADIRTAMLPASSARGVGAFLSALTADLRWRDSHNSRGGVLVIGGAAGTAPLSNFDRVAELEAALYRTAKVLKLNDCPVGAPRAPIGG